MQKALFAHRPDLAVAEEARQTHRPEPLLDQLRVMMRTAKEILSPPVATAQTAAVYRFVAQLLPGARQQFLHVLSGGILRPALELDRLAQARQRPHGNAPGARVGAQQVADQEVATVEVLQVLVDHQPNEQVAARSLLLLGRE